MAERLTTFVCAICGKPVRLGECKVNDFGEPVHEECYAEKHKEEKEEIEKRKAKLDRWRA